MVENFFVCLAVIVSGAYAHGILSYNGDEYPECKADLEKLTSKENSLWALKILDASTKIPSGILTGHFVDYGNFDECLDPNAPIKTQFCISTIVPPDEVIMEISGNESTLASVLALRWSYCIPASCPPAILQQFLQNILQDAKMNVTVSSSDCSTKDSKEMARGDWVGVSIWGIFIAATIISTIYEVVVSKTKYKKRKRGLSFVCEHALVDVWLSAFSVYTNGKNLLKTDITSETMLPLHGLRFLSICWVVLGHRYYFLSTTPLLNLMDFAKELKEIRSEFFLQGVLAVDSFFFLSGFLNCYNLLKVLQKLNRFPFFMYYIHRYIRLTPALAAIVLMYATWYPLIGNGPVWNQTTLMWKELCVNNWWPTLLYINNYYNPITQCAGQSWYLAVDMQLYWLSPFIIIPLWKRPRIGMALLWLLLILSTVGQFLIAIIYKFRMPFTFGFDSFEEMENITKLLYVPTHSRAAPYIIGVMTGYYIYTLKKTQTRLVMSKGLLFSGWILSTLVAFGVFFGGFQFSRPLADHPFNKWESSIYIALHRIGWSVVIGWIIIACLNGQGGVINSILSWKAFIPLSRLTYCIFLSHMAIQQFHVGTARTSEYFQYFNQIHRFFGDLLFSVLTATGLSLVFESPVLALEKLLRKKPQERNLKREVNDGFQDDFNATDKTHEI